MEKVRKDGMVKIIVAVAFLLEYICTISKQIEK